MRHARTLTLAAFALTSSLAAAENTAPASATPLFDYATSQPPVTRPFDDEVREQIATFAAEIARHPPPPDAECAHTLGASRFARMYDDLGTAHSNAGDHTAAITAFEKALACTPRAANIHAELATELLHVGRIADARAAAARGVAIDGDNAALDSILMQLDFVEERWAEAVSRLRAMIASQQDEERAMYYQCFLWLAQRRAGIRTPELVARPTEYDQWPAPILERLRGSMSEADLLREVLEEKNEQRRRELLAEALFYVGESRLAEGDIETGRRYLAAVVTLKILYFIEHHLALRELDKLRAG